ncbi:serine/threonine protein kinase [Paenibacillus albicereus]|uniref:Serine/threonine protein kinase n=1 Tax=Paenibacillus albicereus TaxID=2726185 RepID=A0A6H2GXA2_9BACL|nr:serine/threonine-protein kinase [Paenibacillus albicereus]QJC52027.1 serine/threonine protein kinase [Paenibacillus albicereus]
MRRKKDGMRSTEETGQLGLPEEAAEGSLQPGDVVGGRYRVLSLIGQGGMGEVYAAEDLRLGGALRALKLKPAGSWSELPSADEARLHMKLEHPHLPRLHDYFPSEGGRPEMLVMDYIEGCTLEEAARARPEGYTALEAAAAALQLGSALAYLHEQRPPIIHRDLKPANVMAARSGRLMLIDFGIARRFSPEAASDTTQLGTPGYAAPEQLAGCQSDARTDMYGLGCLLVRLMRGAAPDLRVQAGRTKELPYWLTRLLEPERARRFASMREAESAIRSWLEGEGETPPPAGGSGPFGGLSAAFPAAFPAALPGAAAPGRISVLSLSPGSGATFICLMLARLAADRGWPVQAAELACDRPHWQALLGAPEPLPAALDPRFGRWLQDGVEWLPRQSGAPDLERDEASARLDLMLKSRAGTLQLLDWSSGWTAGDALQRIAGSAAAVVVADPDPSRWSRERIRLLEELSARLGPDRIHWIANKDVRFADRREWLGLLPARPSAFMPFLDAESWYGLLWQGFPLPRRGEAAAAVRGALSPLLERIAASLRI